MKTLTIAILAAGLAGCAATPAPAPAPTPAPAPAVEAPKPPPPPTPPPAPAPAAAKPAEPATPEPAAKKPAKGPLGLPAIADLETQVGLDKKSLKACKEVYASYKEKAKAAQDNVKNAADKKTARQEAAALRTEILGKLKEHCTDEQKKKLDEIAAPPKKEKKP